MKRTCTYCRETKDITQFSIKSNGKDGRNSLCKACVKIKANDRINKRTLDPTISEKKCTKCKLIKKISEFAKDKTKQDGHYSSCKSCNEQYVKDYRQKNPDKVSSAKKNAYLKKKDYYENYKRGWYKDNFDELSKKAKKYREDNRESIVEYQRKKHKEKREKIIEGYSKIKFKQCIKCNLDLSVDKFDKYRSGKFGLKNICKACSILGKEKRKEKHNEYRKGWYRLNKTRILTQGYEKKKQKLKSDPVFKLKETISHRIRRTIYDRRGVKSKRTLELLGCSVEKARRHIERQFKPGMTWDNHGVNGWHIDHIVPCSAFDLTDPKEQEKCFNYKNLQPLWSEENLKKGKKHSRQQNAYAMAGFGVNL